jgi:dephospho-CoA kinase
LNEAIRCGGTTIRSYTSSLGVTGRFQLKLKVHTKDGCQCPNCSATILKTTVGGRGTYYCPCCQVKTRPFLIGITGGIGSGKSKVSNYLLSKGYDVIDTDKISHALSSSNEVIQQIEIAFGKEYLENGTLNRKKLGSLVFKDVDANKKLTSILHPLIKTEVKKEINVAARLLKPLVFIDVPLLYESGFDELVNKVICVSTTEEINIARLMKRDNIDEIYAKEKIASQMKMETKKQLADFNVDNSFDLCYTYKQIDQILNDKLKVKGKQDEI